jgi:hypothetical protein
MANYFENLNLDEEALTSLADAHWGYAQYLQKLENRKFYPYIASCYLIAGIYSALINPKNSRESFLRSARFYFFDGNLYWKILAICADDENLFKEYLESLDLPVKEKPDDLFADILGRQYQNARHGEVNAEIDEFYSRSLSVGRLGLPLQLYLNAFIEASQYSNDNSERAVPMGLGSLAVILDRTMERTRLLQSDSYHWKRLVGGFLPLEPEVLATCIGICHLLNRRQGNIASIIEQLPIERDAKIHFQIAAQIIRPGNEEMRYS